MHIDEFGSLITFHRKRAGLTQTDLAKHAGVSRYVVQDLEAGAGRTSLSRLMPVLTVLNVRLEPEGPLVDVWKLSREGKDA